MVTAPKGLGGVGGAFLGPFGASPTFPLASVEVFGKGFADKVGHGAPHVERMDAHPQMQPFGDACGELHRTAAKILLFQGFLHSSATSRRQ